MAGRDTTIAVIVGENTKLVVVAGGDTTVAGEDTIVAGGDRTQSAMTAAA